MNELQGKVAVVTGGCGGIGFTTVKRFLGAGARVLLVDRLQAEVDDALQRLDSRSVVGFAGDVASADDTARFMDLAATTFGGLDAVVLNAGVEGVVRPLLEYPEDDFDRVMATNVKGVFLGLREAIPHLHRRGSGSVVVIGSAYGQMGVEDRVAYVASKHAVNGIVKSAALELAPLRIRVNAIAPGIVDNRMTRSVEERMAPGQSSEMRALLTKRVPMARYALNEEIAELALFLCGTRCSYSTGSVFVADGGLTAR